MDGDDTVAIAKLDKYGVGEFKGYWTVATSFGDATYDADYTFDNDDWLREIVDGTIKVTTGLEVTEDRWANGELVEGIIIYDGKTTQHMKRKDKDSKWINQL